MEVEVGGGGKEKSKKKKVSMIGSSLYEAPTYLSFTVLHRERRP